MSVNSIIKRTAWSTMLSSETADEESSASTTEMARKRNSLRIVPVGDSASTTEMAETSCPPSFQSAPRAGSGAADVA